MRVPSQGVPPPIVAWARALPEELYLREEVCAETGISATMLHDWARADPRLGAARRGLWQGKWVHLYTAADVEALVAHAAHLEAYAPTPVGGPRQAMWDAGERARRATLSYRMRSLRKRAGELSAAGKDDSGRLAQAEEVFEELAAQYRARHEQLRADKHSRVSAG